MEAKEEIPKEECWALLESGTFGRVALSMEGLPAILPVQYYLAGKSIAICLGTCRVPEHAASEVVIAFSVDDIDPVLRRGWSVQAVGRASFDYHEIGVRTDCGEPAAGQIVFLEPTVISGQWLNLCPFILKANASWELRSNTPQQDPDPVG